MFLIFFLLFLGLISPICSFLTVPEEKTEETSFITELTGRGDTWLLEMLQEFQREIRIYFIFWPHDLKRYGLSVCAAAVSVKKSCFFSHYVNRNLVQKAFSCVIQGLHER